MELTPGGNAPIPSSPLTIRVQAGADLDVSAFRLYANGKVQDGVDMVFYGQPSSTDGAIKLAEQGRNTAFTVTPSAIAAGVEKVSFAVTVDNGRTVDDLVSLKIAVFDGNNELLSGSVKTNGRTEAALIMGELYRRNNEWKFRFIAQGFNGGLKPLAEHYGVKVDDEPAPTPVPKPAPVPPPPPAPAPTISLKKVTLSKDSPTVSLTKRGNGFGKIKINLNWNRGNTKKGFLSGVFGNRNEGIDLDLGAFVETADGDRHVVQALGDGFGSYSYEPFVELQADDRTGDSVDGEWVFINGDQWQHIREVLVYTFIYEGVPSWENTDGIVTINMPDQPPIETHLTEGSSRKNMCAIARLVNDNGKIKVERINRYFTGHKEMDDAFGWGFRWKAGSK
ncbi:TerD family protein [Aeromonas salmonicida]|uniref:TerD family protein n=1 Tax=Aeromonas salmonicida TaxID=645 RepID=UPI0038B9BAE0